jgi:hypothetical protein
MAVRTFSRDIVATVLGLAIGFGSFYQEAAAQQPGSKAPAPKKPAAAAPQTSSPSSPTTPGAKPAAGAKPTGAKPAADGAKPADTAKPAGVAPAKEDPKPAPQDDADAHFRRGNDLYRAEKLVEAEQAYEAAWAMKKAHDIAANLGYTEDYLGKHREAATHLAWAVKNWPPTGKADKRDYTVKRFAEVRQKVGALRVSVSRPGAQVFVDGESVGLAPLDDEVFVDPGTRTVEAKLEGFEGAPVKVDASAGGTLEVNLELSAIKPKEALKPVVPEGPVVDESAVKQRRIIIIAGAGAAVVGLGLGIGFTAAANGKSSDAGAQRGALGTASACYAQSGSPTPACAELEATVKSQETLTNAAIGSFVAGGLLAAGTAAFGIWQWMSPPMVHRSTPSARLVPVVSPTQAGAAVVGAW